jgi:hypothetical protein
VVVVASNSNGATSSGAVTSNDTGGATNETGGATTDASSQTTTGSLAGYVLIFSESPPEPPPSNGSSTTTTPTAGTTGTGSSFDGEPVGQLKRIDEDWELTITQPDCLISAPQVGTVMTPFDDADNIYWAFALNHRVNSSFAAGGMELQLWYQGQLLGWYTLGSEVMSTMNEKVTWTQRLEIQGGKLRFAVVNGQSDTWGTFGQGESLHLDITTTLPDLNDYHPKVSIDNSGVMFAANRVGTLILKAVRGYDKDGTLVSEDTNPVTVFGGASP